MPSTSHRQKRPYAGQASITSFFHPSSDSPAAEHSAERSLSPALPPNVQSNLLSVGMRVRKSVPEGYKTGSYSAFRLFSDDSTMSLPVEQKDKKTERPMNQVVYGGARKELTPFCGLMKVGGMAVQQQEVSEDGWMGGSQGSTVSTVSEGSVIGSGKRRFEDEGDEEEMNVSVERRIAMPKSRLARKKAGGQENMEDFEEADFLDPQWREEEMDDL